MESLIGTLQNIVRDIVTANVAPEDIPKIGAALVILSTLTQALKKTAEAGARVGWTGRVGPIRAALLWLSHGDGPVVINAVATLGAVFLAGASDPTIRDANAFAVTGVAAGFLAGTDGAYRLLRSVIFPKTIVTPSSSSADPLALPADVPIAPASPDDDDRQAIFDGQFVDPFRAGQSGGALDNLAVPVAPPAERPNRDAALALLAQSMAELLAERDALDRVNAERSEALTRRIAALDALLTEADKAASGGTE